MPKLKWIWVRAVNDAEPVPVEGSPERRIGAVAVRVPWSWFYQRRINEGELVEVLAPTETP